MKNKKNFITLLVLLHYIMLVLYYIPCIYTQISHGNLDIKWYSVKNLMELKV